eukprot:CAMPEP_0114666628 /NCGR_PEP_ID=MMETSP0191-20121206/32870_1 /TAXON_ID=126664 /ORGANISM="Sorites sp." /LENGTH=197 /DNA_ID=CAMNT_0001914705 /DNA_START=49 /DNA_END=639 /DNA_ORIENTATION=+
MKLAAVAVLGIQHINGQLNPNPDIYSMQGIFVNKAESNPKDRYDLYKEERYESRCVFEEGNDDVNWVQIHDMIDLSDLSQAIRTTGADITVAEAASLLAGTPPESIDGTGWHFSNEGDAKKSHETIRWILHHGVKANGEFGDITEPGYWFQTPISGFASADIRIKGTVRKLNMRVYSYKLGDEYDLNSADPESDEGW